MTQTLLFQSKKEIHQRIYFFILSVLDVTKRISKTIENEVLIKQVIRSVTSIGANGIEADNAETRKEFIYRLAIAKKEASETSFWLSLLADHNTSQRSYFLSILQENKEIIAILSRIIINTKNKSS